MLCCVCLTALLSLRAAHGVRSPVAHVVYVVGSLLEVCMYLADHQSCCHSTRGWPQLATFMTVGNRYV